VAGGAFVMKRQSQQHFSVAFAIKRTADGTYSGVRNERAADVDLLPAFAVPEHDVLQRRQPFQPDRPARVQLVVRDADFRA
jgi:hypothetical protein